MSRQSAELSYAIRFGTVGHFFGELCSALALLTLVPLMVSIVLDDSRSGFRFGVVVMVLAATGALLRLCHTSRRLQTNEAMVITALVFLVTPLLMAYPMMSSGINFLDALFEAVSAGTTTGLSVVANGETQSRTFHFTRAWMQWYGGLGIVVLSLAILVRPGLTAKTLAVSDHHDHDLAGGTRAHARKVVLVYSALTAVGVILLWLIGGDLFNGMLYTFSAVSTGGFSPHARSLLGYGAWPLQWTVTLLCLAGAVSLTLYHDAFRPGPPPFYRDLQLRSLLFLALLFTMMLALCMAGNGWMWDQALYHAPLLALSAQTTSGFSTVDVAQLDAASKGMLIFSMAIGGGIGSTAGGFKLLRLLILLRILHVVLIRTCLPPHAVLDPRLGSRKLEDDEIREALSIILLFLVVTGISWLPFLALGYDPLDALFEVVSAMGTVGLSTGIAAPELPRLLKGILCVDMLMGRLEMVAWFVLFYPKTWIGKRAEV